MIDSDEGEKLTVTMNSMKSWRLIAVPVNHASSMWHVYV